jgi:hypothetical protein
MVFEVIIFTVQARYNPRHCEIQPNPCLETKPRKICSPSLGDATCAILLAACGDSRHLPNRRVLLVPETSFLRYCPGGSWVGGSVIAIRAEEEWSRTERIGWLFLAVVLSVVAIAAIGQENDKRNRDEASSRQEEQQHFESIIGGLQNTIATSATQFAATMRRSNQIVGSVQESINTITGGNSFCYLAFTASKESETSVTIGRYLAVQQGKYPLYGVHARVVDLTKAPHTSADFNAATITLNIGDLAKDTSESLPSIVPFVNGPNESFNIFFSAHNGLWTENLRMRDVSGAWRSAIRVFRDRIGKQGKYESYNVFELVDPEYPLINGKVDW